MTSQFILKTCVSLALVVLGWPQLVWACTTFLAEHGGQFVYGKNYDWYESSGFVVVNPRDLAKTAFVLQAGDTPATWIARYGSVTFNQYGVELPNGGVNEQGLVIETMILDKTQYPPKDARPVLNELQWIQHALDRFATVDELLQAAPTVRISEAHAKLHYLVCDATGTCAVVEYLDGELAVTRGDALVCKTLANDTYQESLAYLTQFEGSDGANVPSPAVESLDRFVRVALGVKTISGTLVPDSGFAMLDSVRQSSTVWSTVYALGEGVVYFQTKANTKVKTLPFLNLDYSGCRRRILDVHLDVVGDVTASLEDYSSEANLRLLQKTLESMSAFFPAGTTERLAAYPDTLPCLSESMTDAGSKTAVTSPRPDGGIAFRWDGGASTSQAESSKGGCTIGRPTGQAGLGFVLAILGLIGGVIGLRRKHR
jgi:choloylglycine hydrolase